MAITSDGADCFQFIDIKYKCKHFKTIRRRDLKEYYQNIPGNRHVKEEIVLLEQVRHGSAAHHEHHHQEQIPGHNHNHHHRFVKYSKRRCNCKIKKLSPDKYDDGENNYNKGQKTADSSSTSCQFRGTSFLTSSLSSSTSSETCTSILASVWHWTAFASPMKSVGKTTTNSYIFNQSSSQPSPGQKGSSVFDSSLVETLLPYKLESTVPSSCSYSPSSSSVPPTRTSTKSPPLTSKHETFNWRSRNRTKPPPTQLNSAFCDNSNDDYSYITSNSNKFNARRLTTTSRKKQQTTTSSSSSIFECQQLTHPKLTISCSYMLMILIMIVKELIRHFSDTLKRMRRKTQLILPILILLQLLIAAPLTHCTSSPPNQTLAAVMSASSSSSLSDALTETEELSSLPTTTSSSASSSSNSNLNMENKKTPEQEKQQNQMPSSQSVSKVGTISHRPTGGSSITSYISHEAKIRRDPSLSYSNSGCHSCQMREQVKADNLESIKRHILLRLEMQTLPNITAPQVPRTIIENFYKNHSLNENNKKTSSSSSSSSSSNHNQQENSQSSSGTSSGYVYTTLSLPQFVTSNGNDGIKRNDNMQGDDPNIFSNDYDQNIGHDHNDDEDKDDELLKNDLEDEFFSVINSVYVFPTMPRMRHNRKAEILNFKFKGNEHSTISQALLHVYIRGRDWIRENAPDTFDTKNHIHDDHREIIITIHRVIRRMNSTIATHTVNVTESQHKIPNGPGQWISIDVTQLVQGWVRNTTTNQGIVIKVAESWMKPFIITGDLPNNKAFTVYIEMLTKDNRKRRTKRNTSMNCSESDNEERCCRYPLVVNFVEFDWTWVVAPTSFNAYFCNGECKLGFLEKYPHTHLMQLSTAPQPCCSPTKMSPLNLLYFNTENTLVMSTIPNMAVEKCSCS